MAEQRKPFDREPPTRPLVEADAKPRPRVLLRATNLLRGYFAALLRVNDEHKTEIYAGVFRGADFADLNYWLEVVFSIGIATLGLIINSPAVVIGAMLISPLMGPIIASGLAIALGDFYLGFKAVTNTLLSVLASVFLAALITWLLPFRSPTPEILARIQPTLLDLGVAVLSGMAGAIVVCRGGRGGGVTALPGVAVAVALMPPLGVIGFGIGIGWDTTVIGGGGLLFLTNLVAIILSSFLVFFSVRMDAPATRQRISAWLEEQEKTERFYAAIERTPLRRLLGKVGTLPRRVLILLLFLATVSFPLRQSLSRLGQEAQIRRAALEELHRVIQRDAIVREDLDVLPERVRLRVVAMLPQGFSAERRRHLEELIERRAGRPANVTVLDVATRQELAELTGRLTAKPETSPESVDEIRTKLWGRVRPAIAAAWPSDRAPLIGYALTLEPEASSLTIHLAYLAEEQLGSLGEQALRKVLSQRIGSAGLQVRFERVPPAVDFRFPVRSHSLSRSNRRKLDEVAATLRRFPQARGVVEIAAAETGKLDALAQRRSDEIQGYLAREHGITASRLKVKVVQSAEHGAVLKLLPPPQP